MRAPLKNLLLSPRLWLSAGVLSLGVGIVIGYHQDQMAAQNALAQKVALPAQVIIQDFSSDRHENLLNEVHVLAEAALDRTVRIDVGDENSPRLVDIVPLFPVSRQSLPIATSILTTDIRRPVARALAPQLAERNKILASAETILVGLMVFEADQDREVIGFEHLYLAQGSNGPLVDLTGVHVGASAILQQAAGPLAANGIRITSGTFVVSPYLHGRLSGPEFIDFSALRHTLFRMSVLMITFGLALLFSLLPSIKTKKKAEVSYEVKAVGAFPAVDPFQPITAQDELAQEENGYSPARLVSRVSTAAANTFRAKSRP